MTPAKGTCVFGDVSSGHDMQMVLQSEKFPVNNDGGQGEEGEEESGR